MSGLDPGEFVRTYLETESIPALPPQHRAAPSSPPRLLFRSARLKDPDIKVNFTAFLEHYAQEPTPGCTQN